MTNGNRTLIVMADDYGIGPATSQAILHLATKGLVTGTVLLTNSPYAEEAVRRWRQAGKPMELGWHPCLTMDPPLAPPGQVPTLVGPDGCLWPLGTFVRRLYLGQVRGSEIAVELQAQFERFRSLVGRAPTVVNSHQHVQLFHPVGPILLELLARHGLPYVRRVHEPWSMLARIPGARLKRTFLTLLGRRQVRRQIALGLPGNDWLAGITDPPCVADSEFFSRWLTRVPGEVVELACHPGYLDPTLIGRDCSATDGRLARRVDELQRLQEPSFRTACQRAGFTLIAPSQLSAARQARVA
jgi:predicted glycoside hydrolase/deacetylase ChbG (UPF0249 family)